MTRLITASLLVLLLVAALRAAEPTAAQFKALCGVAQDMDHTTIGEAYEDQFTAQIQDAMRSALKGCAARSTPPYEVDLVFVIAADGKVEHVFADPQQPVSACVAAKLLHEKLPPPPRPEWMQLVNINIRQ